MMKVKDVMKKHVVTVDPDMNMSTISKILTNNRIGSVVIMDKGKPIGMVTTNDIVTLIAKSRDPKNVKAGKYWKERNRPFITVSKDESIMKVAKKMIKTGLKRFPVVESGELKGIISTKEILLVSPELIEILSEKLKSKVDAVARPEQTISGLCEKCGEYSDELKSIEGRWICQDCREM
jgi:CBS domain-containing protein